MKKAVVGGAGVAAGLGLLSAGAAAYVAKMVQGRATGDVDGFLDRKDPNPRDVVVCLGASIVRGRASVDFVDILREHLPQFEFVNGGINSDTAADVLARLDPIIDCRPKAVVILVGTSDAQAILEPASAFARKRRKDNPDREPESVAAYREQVAQIVAQLSSRTSATIGLCSLPPLGQQLDSPANEVIRALNEAIKSVAETSGQTYIPVYEAMAKYLRAHDADATKPYTSDWRIGARSLSQHFIVGRSYDAIAEKNGLLLSPDYVHLNSVGATIVADTTADFLRKIALTSPYGKPITVPTPPKTDQPNPGQPPTE